MYILFFFFLKREHPATIAGHWKIFKPTSSGLVPLPHYEADTHISLPSFSSTRPAPLLRALDPAATSSQDCLPGQLLPLRLWGDPCPLQNTASAHCSVVVSKPASPSGHPLPQGGSSPCARSPWCPNVSSAWLSAHLERGDERALLSQQVSGGDGALPWEGVSVSGLSFIPSSLPFPLSIQEGGFLQFGVFFFYLFIFNWRIIALQYCIGFCHPQSLLYFLTQKGTVQNKGSSEVARHHGEQEGGCSEALPPVSHPLRCTQSNAAALPLPAPALHSSPEKYFHQTTAAVSPGTAVSANGVRFLSGAENVRSGFGGTCRSLSLNIIDCTVK